MNFSRLWNYFVILLALINAVIIPLILVFQLVDDFNTTIIIFEIIISSVFLGDIFLKKYYFKENYSIKSISFIFDFLAALPIGMLLLTQPLQFFSLFRVCKLYQVDRQLHIWRQKNMLKSSLRRMIHFFLWIILAVHWLSCGWIAQIDTIIKDKFLTYVQSLYWCLTTLTTVGYGDITPDKSNPVSLIYTMFAMILGVATYGFIIGNIANMLSNRDLAQVHYMEKMDKINAFLKYHKIPGDLQKKIRNYYNYLWTSRRAFDETTIVNDLPDSMKTEISLYLNRQIIEKVPIFKGGSDQFIRELVLMLKPIVAAPGDFIIQVDEIGDRMYFISKGNVEVVSKDSFVLATLTEGNFFGEVALLKSQERNASVRALEYCDLYSLHKNDFDAVLHKFPQFEKHIKQKALKRL